MWHVIINFSTHVYVTNGIEMLVIIDFQENIFFKRFRENYSSGTNIKIHFCFFFYNNYTVLIATLSY